MDFVQIATKEGKDGKLEVYPDFVVGRTKDLMVRGRAFYAVWDEEKGLWSTDEYDVQRLVDQELSIFAEKVRRDGRECTVRYLRSFGNNQWTRFRNYISNLSDNSVSLDNELTFSNQKVKKTDYVSRRLPYPLEEGSIEAWDELVGTLYSPQERAKIEWAIGTVVSGDSKTVQKFMVFYGPAGTGKSTILNVISKLFEGYTATFDARALGTQSAAFATEVFRDNPLVAIQHDGDLSKIEDNTRLNSIVSHEKLTMNEKYKASYTAKVNAFLFMGTNQPVRITDAKSGIIRRLIDVHPTGNRLPADRYFALMSQIDFELGAIAHHCLQTYHQMGKNYYAGYRPVEMMLQTDIFFNFVEAHYDIFKGQDGITLRQAYSLYKEFCADTGIDRVLPQYKVREELRNYFDDFRDRATIDGVTVRSYYSGFSAHPFKTKESDKPSSLVLEETTSIFDMEYSDAPAQYTKEDGTPKTWWNNVHTKLSEIDTGQLHYVKLPENHIVIDFDLRGEDGGRSLERNLRAASYWPATYAELSKSGRGVHLHYLYAGSNASELASNYSEGIEIKTFRGGASLRRLLTRCNNVPISEMPPGGLPLKEAKVHNVETIQSERGLRELIARNLRKEIHPGTKPSVDFIHKILEDAYDTGLQYDVTDLKGRIISFANNSTNQALTCLRTVQDMKFKSEMVKDIPAIESIDDRPVFFDVEVFPNLLIVCWKYQEDDNVVRMINPDPSEIEALFRLNLVGFNNRRYDNHILYGRYLGYDNEAIFKLSSRIIGGSIGAMFGEAYGLSYTDIYDFSSKKQSLKKFGVELGLFHFELEFPWDQPLPEEHWQQAVEYCVNDVVLTEATFEARRQDFVARQILAELSGLSVNHTTQNHTARIIFGNEKNPQRDFVYTNLAEDFPGYIFDNGVSTYRGETTGEGGYVYSEPGMYNDVVLLDVASMHPASIERLYLFGRHTPRFSELKEARMAIKHGEYARAKKMLNGKLAPYLKDDKDAVALSYALKIVINIVYGLTSAKFDNPFRDNRNKDNIVAKRGALFMIDLKHFVQQKGFTVAHIKTDSIKIPGATAELIADIFEFGAIYGYDFEHEATYDRFCLVNNAVYVARKAECLTDCWTAVGAQFQHPYVFKTLFTGDEIEFEDLCETREVRQGVMYLDFDSVQKPAIFSEGEMHHVGRIGRFVPVTQESGGGLLLRVKDDKPYAVTGTKGYFWLEAHIAQEKLNKGECEINMLYFESLVAEARKTIQQFGPIERLTDDQDGS